jgi:peptidoglycan/LPS O-acetylase OafA/YrhL
MYARPYLAAALVGIVISCRLPVLHPILESKPATYIAAISYALYIYHPLMIWGWMDEGSTMVRYLLKRPVSYAMTWAAAHASTFWWEAYWQRLAHRLTAERVPRIV